jgi:hypothetical protein
MKLKKAAGMARHTASIHIEVVARTERGESLRIDPAGHSAFAR